MKQRPACLRLQLPRVFWRISFFLLLVTPVARTSFAQGLPYKGDVHGNFGYGNVSDDDGSLGNGPVIGGGIGYRFSRRWGVSVDISRNAHNRDFSREGIVHKWDGHSLILNGSLLVHFRPESRTQPYIRFGLSYAQQELTVLYKETPSFGPPEVQEETRSTTNNFLGLDLGAGVRIFVAERISVKPQFRLATLSVRGGGFPDTLWATWFCVGIGYHW